MQSNFTWSKALGTASIYQAVSEFTVDDPYNLGQGYGRQGFDRRITFNAFLVYQPPFYKGQSGLMGRLLGGWTFSSVFTTGSGTPIEVGSTYFNGQEFGIPRECPLLRHRGLSGRERIAGKCIQEWHERYKQLAQRDPRFR